jgi:hypothetical protein
MSVQDLNSPAGSSGSFNYNFDTLTETIYLNPVAQTIREVGVISGTPSATQISFQDNQQIAGVFPNPPQNIPGSVTVTLAPTGGGLSFDTGTQPVTWDSGIGAYTFNGDLGTIGSFAGSYSLNTGGQTYSGSFTYGLTVQAVRVPENTSYTFNTVSTINYPNSLTLSGLGTSLNAQQWNYWSLATPSPSLVPDVVANNGFDMELGVGVAAQYGSAYGEEFQWNSPGTITATMVPEPASVSLLAFGMFGITLLRRHQR